ncbi:DUF397 domain-containing protein [Streptomyces xanthochromogenes]|uniref:DUF397 domain-containing protein n=1 Tax=Streptomyces xanthochromogenes TaxID=67384 RepID=UPI00343BC0A7
MNNRIPTEWIKSSHSGPEGGNCLEWAPTYAEATGIVPIRDSKHGPRGGPTLTIAPAAWAAFVTGLKA